MATAIIILAAGMGTRMNSDKPKVLHELAGAPLLVHAMKSSEILVPDTTVVVVGHGAEAVGAVAKAWNADSHIVHQAEQLGTGHAVAEAAEVLDGFEGDALVLFGDTPFIAPDTLRRLREARRSSDVVVLGFEPDDPGRYGRLLLADDGSLDRIVEFKDANEAERAIRLCNSGVMIADCVALLGWVNSIGNANAAGEYYLTDVIALARANGASAGVVTCDESETLGINTRDELARAEQIYQEAARRGALSNGVTMDAPETVFFAHDTVVGRDSRIEPNVVFGPGVTIESGARIRAFSHLEGCHVSRGAVVGPYARLRPGAELSENVRVGNFVEIKNAEIGEGAKVNHLTYVGDAQIGERANVGAGTVTCNYDGVFKHRTTIGADAFIGSSTMLVAPVAVGKNAMTASGSVITQDVPDGALAVGRARQENKAGMATKLFSRLRALKEKRSKGA